MYRDFWRLHVVAAIGLVCALGLAGDEASQGHGGKAALWILASVACLGVLIAPLYSKHANVTVAQRTINVRSCRR